MRILFVTPYLPAPPNFGGAARMYHLIQEIGRRHQAVTLSLAGPDDDPRPSEDALGRVVPVRVATTARRPPSRAKRLAQLRSLASRRSFQDHFYRQRALQQALDRITREEPFDLVQFEFSQMGGYDVVPGLPTVLDVHNVEHDVLRQAATGDPLRRLFNQIEHRKFRREEFNAWRRADVCLATSVADATMVQRAIRRPAEVIPNGVDLGHFPRTPLEGTDAAALVFSGAMRYLPNTDAALWAADAIMPVIRSQIPRATLTLAGADPPPAVQALADQADIRVTGTVPEVVPYLQAAGTVVVPLRGGGGTRLKILEAFAVGRPVVSTTLGATGLDVEDGRHLLLADSPAGFAAAIARLDADAGLRQRLADEAYALVRERYQWSAIAARLEQVLTRLVDERR